MSTENATSQIIVCCGVIWKHFYGAGANAGQRAVGWTQEQVRDRVESTSFTSVLDFNSAERQLKAEGAQWVADLWTTDSHLRVDFGRQALGVSGLRCLAQRLAALTTLGLNSCELGDAGVQILASALDKSVSSPLVSLSLSDNSISDTGCISLVTVLAKHCQSLQALYLNWNSIGDSGLRACFDLLPLQSTCGLRSLTLDGNACTDAGVFDLSDVLLQNRSLTHLSMSNNLRITSVGAEKLLDALSINYRSALTSLSLRSIPAIDTRIRDRLALCASQPHFLRAPWGRRREWLALWKNGTAPGALFTSPGACAIQIDSSVPSNSHPDVGVALSDEDAASAMAVMLQSCPRDVFVSVLRYL